MDVEPDISRISRTIGEPTRIRMLTLLMEGRALTAKELAYGSGVEPATATAHLQRLLADALVVSLNQGRHKYFRLASTQVADCVEALMAVALPAKRTPPEREDPIRVARFCYDHLAGRIGTQITDALVQMKLIALNGEDFVVSKKGARLFAKLGLDLAAVAASRRKFAHVCLDWSERRHHLGGALGAALANHFIHAGWIKRKTGTRAVVVTAIGQQEWPAI
jgi:DNA-binding transcriptional ArsR family regulator